MKAILAAAVLALAARAASAQEVVPWPHRPGIEPVSLVAQSLEASIRDQAARVTLQSTFHNPNAAVFEGTALFPLPAGAQVDAFTMTVDGKELGAELLDADKARKIYDEIVRSRRDPALLELVGGRLLRASVFPVPANGELKIKLAYTQLLPRDGTLVEFRAPFTRNLTGSRPLREAVAAVTIASAAPIKAVYSPTHAVDVVRRDDRNARAGWEAKNVEARKDFLLHYAVDGRELGVSLLTYREPGQDGYFVLLASPGVEVDASKVLPKDVVFIFDRSGSMSGEKIQQAREALLQCIGALHARDRFAIVDFASDVRTFEPALVEAGEDERARARKYVEAIRAAGSTNIEEALQAGVALLPKDPARLPLILFATDGLPTVGEQKPEKLVRTALERNRADARIFAFGVGLDVNALFLDRLAEEGRGARDYVAPEEKIEAKVAALMDKVSSPVLGGVALDVTVVTTQDVYPRRLPDLFKGQQLAVFGRYRGAGHAAIDLRGTAGGEAKRFVYEASFPETDLRHDFLPRLWAGRKIAYLLDAVRLSGEAPKELIEEIASLSKRFGIVTPYTSYLITEDAPRLGERARDGFRAAAGSGAPAAPEAEKRKVQAESLALKAAKESDALEGFDRNAEQARREAGGRKTTALKSIGTKTFYLKDGVWTDGAFDEKDRARVVKVEFLSEEWRKLADSGLARWLAAGERVLVVDGERFIEVVAK
jgi:Ca-activated chloride channel family protein